MLLVEYRLYYNLNQAPTIRPGMKKQSQLTNQIKKLQYQLSYSEHINKELSAQLATLCTRTGIAPTKFKNPSEIPLINASTHLQELYYVEPLLMCYEEVMHLLRAELEEAREQAKAIGQNVTNIVEENNFIRKELEGKIELLSKADNLGLNVNFLTLENKDLNDKIAIINSKNQYLMRKNSEISQEYQKLKSENLSLFGQHELKSLENRAKQQSKLKETQLLGLKTEIDVLKHRLENQQKIVADYNTKILGLENEILKLKNELKITRQQLQNNTVVHQRLKDNLQTQLSSLKQQLSSSIKKQQQLFTKTMSLQSQLQDKNNRIHNSNIQNSQLQANNNNMLQMLESYEVKVSGMAKKIKKLETEVKELGDERGEANRRAEIAEWKLGEKGDEMDRRDNQWKKEKARINKMWEDRLEAVKKSYQIPSSAGKV